MKIVLKSLFVVVAIFCGSTAFAQVQIDKPIELTGSGADAKVTGIADVSTSSDAVNVSSLQNGNLVYALATGADSTYMVNLSPAVSALQAGMIVNFKANFATAGQTSVNVNGLGAVAIKKYVTDDVTIGDILNDQMVSVIYDGTNFQLLSQLGTASSGGGSSSGGGDNSLIYTVNGF